ncbi:MAG TPA: alpha/beta hydrolase [Actinomycetes bacterium]|nr:alpha/beta hydrolase [Actinomycetes bacterium]
MTRPTRLAAATLALGVLLTGCSGDPTGVPSPSTHTGPTGAETRPAPPASAPADDPATDPALASYYQQTLRWASCESASGTAGFECATLTVPVDYADPDGPTLGLAVNRLPASGPRLGSLVLNPGGPGGSGVEYAGYATAVVSSPVRERYDVVGFDPRGVATSDPVRCLDDRETDVFLAADASPDDAAEVARLVELSQQLGQRCQARNPEVLAHLGTEDVARDLDVLRAALGDDDLHYLGKSYGTFIGATYAEMFPWRVGRLVLDGALDPRSTSAEINLGQAKGFEVAFSAFLADCLGKRTCPLTGDEADARAQLADFLAAVDRRPLPAGDRQLTQALAVLGVVFAMYDEVFWPQLRSALKAGLSGDGRPLLGLADAYADRGTDGRYGSNQNDVIYAVNCLDRPEPDGPEQLAAAQPGFEKASPLFGAYIAWSSLPCHYWPVKAESAPGALRAAGAAPILVVGTTRDPATPYVWAQGLAEQLDSGVLLTYEGDGHTAYRRGSDCVDSAVDAYLLKGETPAEGTRCD